MAIRCEAIDDARLYAPAPELACSCCGCTESQACPGGCFWISLEPPICSSCGEVADDVERQVGEFGLFGAQRCPASAVPAPHMPIYVDEVSGYCVRCREGFAC